jgi:hypothetical protein
MPEIMSFFLSTSNRKINVIFNPPKHLLLAEAITVGMSVNRQTKWVEGNTTEYTGGVCMKTLRCGRDWSMGLFLRPQYNADVASGFISLPLQWMQLSPVNKTARQRNTDDFHSVTYQQHASKVQHCTLSVLQKPLVTGTVSCDCGLLELDGWITNTTSL